MYSENDFRYYQGGELSHAEKKWNWLPGGKNSKEYNHWYYMTHPEKWGITKAAKDVYNKATEAAGNTETDLDDRALAALGRGARAVKSGAQKVLDKTNVDERVRGYTETLQKRDTAKRKADQARQNASRATSSRTADMYEKQAQQYDRQAKTYDNQARTARNNAGQAIKRGVTNTVSRAGRAVTDTAASAGNFVRTRTNRAINQSPTRVDNDLRRAAKQATSGNLRGAGIALQSAGRHAGEEIRNAGSKAVGAARDLGRRALDATTIDEKLGTAARSLASGNFGGARVAASSAAKEAGRRLRDAGQRALDSTDLDERAVQLGRDARDAVRSIPGRVSDATGLSARNRSQQARANADELNERANADQRKAEAARKLDRDGNGQTPSERSVENIERNAENSRAAAQRAERTAQNAESEYRSTPLGKAETGGRKAGEAATAAAETVKGAAGKTAEEAQRMARKEVRDAMSDYWKAVDQYGVNSPEAQRAAKKAEGTLNSTERSLINKFGNAKNTIEDTISDGINYLKERRENIQIEWDGPFSYTVTDKRRPGYSKKSTPFTDTYTFPITVPTYGTGKASKEYEEELEYNSRKNKYPKR